MTRARLFLLPVLLLLCITNTAVAAYIYQVGTKDNFAAPADPTNPSHELVTVVGNNTDHSLSTQLQTFQDFDLIAGVNGTNNTAVGHTFTDLPSGITGGTFEFRVQAGDNPWVGSDQILFSFIENTTQNWLDTIVWNRPFGPRDYNEYNDILGDEYSDPGMLNHWIEGDTHTFTLDLAALPLWNGGTYNLLPELNSYGFLDVVVEDETGVDYMTLTVHTAPIPAGFFLLGSGLVCLLGLRRKAQ